MFYLFSNDISVNFDKVAVIKKNSERIVINFNYSIKKDNEIFADYLYIDNYSHSDLAFLEASWFKKQFIKISSVYINKNEISNIKFRNNRIIVNMCMVKSHNFNRNDKTVREITSTFYYEDGLKERYLEILNSLKGYNNGRS